jgi:TIR domain
LIPATGAQFVFVSYARQDNSPAVLRVIETVVADLGTPYIDDVHGYEAADRSSVVTAALEAARVFVGVVTPNYLQTPWTRHEFAFAVRRRLPIMALLADGRLVDSAAPESPWRPGVSPLERSTVGQRSALLCLR